MISRIMITFELEKVIRHGNYTFDPAPAYQETLTTYLVQITFPKSNCFERIPRLSQKRIRLNSILRLVSRNDDHNMGSFIVNDSGASKYFI